MKKKTIGTIPANIYAIIIALVISVPIVLLYYYFTGEFKPEKILVRSIKIYIYAIIFFSSILVHEIIHALVFAYFAKKPWKNVKIGFSLKTFTPYAHCKVPVKKIHYTLAVVMPGIILGIIPIIIAFASSSILLLYYGLIMILGAGGDILILLLLRNVPKLMV